MEKAFDIKGLVEILKGEGLNIGEEAAKLLATSFIKWIEMSVVLTENKTDDLVVPFLGFVKPMLMAQIDKIDGVKEV